MTQATLLKVVVDLFLRGVSVTYVVPNHQERILVMDFFVSMLPPGAPVVRDEGYEFFLRGTYTSILFVVAGVTGTSMSHTQALVLDSPSRFVKVPDVDLVGEYRHIATKQGNVGPILIEVET